MHRSILSLPKKFWDTDTKTQYFVRIIFRGLAISLAGLHTYTAIKSQSMNADGISYLDIGDAYFRGDWTNAINAVWSPLYSWILGFVNFIFKPSMAWEFPAVQLVNFLIFVGALLGFEYMWANVRLTSTDNEALSIPEPFWWVLGFFLFVWISLSLIEIWAVTPDMLMAMFVFLAAGLIAKIRAGDTRLRVFLSLGFILGLGYLSKAFMFPIAFVFLLLAWLVHQWTWDSLKRTLPAITVFLLISLPFVALISSVKGKFTIGEAGTVTYIKHVVRIPYPHWQGDPAQGILPTHLSRIIHRSPPVYEFGEPIGGTYPIAFDPSYWYEGIVVPITLGDLIGPLLANAMRYLELFLQKQGTLVACVLLMYILGKRKKMALQETLRLWGLMIPAVIAFGLYGLVLVEDRYIGVFILLFWTDVIANIRLPVSINADRQLKVFSAVAALGLFANIILFNLDGFTHLSPSANRGFEQPSAPAASPLAVAQSLQDLGIQKGAKVGVIGYAYDSYWARLAGVHITAEMLDTDAEDLWRGDETLQQSILQSFADAGTKAVVAEYVPDDAQLHGWYRVGESNYYIFQFSD